jgi:hypothetical protein
MANKNLKDVATFIAERRKQAMQTTVTDPNDKGTPATPANPDAAATAKTTPPSTGNEVKKPDVTDKNQTVANDGKAPPAKVVEEPEAVGKAAAAVTAILKKINNPETHEETKEASEQPASEAKKTVEETAEETAEEKKAGEPEKIVMDQELVVKLASAIRDNEARIAEVQGWLEEDYGAEQADNLIKFAAEADEEVQAELLQAVEAEELIKGASEIYQSLEAEEQAQVDKLAAAIPAMVKDYSEEELVAFDLGMKQAAEMIDNGGELPPVEEAPSIEEIEMMLLEMIEAGEITEEEAAAILEEVAMGDPAVQEELAGVEDVKAAARSLFA